MNWLFYIPSGVLFVLACGLSYRDSDPDKQPSRRKTTLIAVLGLLSALFYGLARHEY